MLSFSTELDSFGIFLQAFGIIHITSNRQVMVILSKAET